MSLCLLIILWIDILIFLFYNLYNINHLYNSTKVYFYIYFNINFRQFLPFVRQIIKHYFNEKMLYFTNV